MARTGFSSTVIIACRVLKETLEPLIDPSVRDVTFLDYGLHRTPRLMAQSIQQRIDSVEQPSLILVGYGLCGNGLVGVKARQHTLVIPRTDDCIALLLGSYQSYRAELAETPGTYFLTRGWLESRSDPLSEYEEYCGKYGPKKAAWIMDEQYRNYRRLCLITYSDDDLAACRPRAGEVAEFCRARWNWRYEERRGSDELIRRLLAFGRERPSDDFVVVLPGDEVRQSDFLRSY